MILIYIGIGSLLALFQVGIWAICDSLDYDEWIGTFFAWFILWPMMLIFAITLGMIRLAKGKQKIKEAQPHD